MEAPHLLGIRQATRGRDVAREEAVEVVDVTDQEPPRIGVVRGVDRLRKVDDHRTIRADEHVELGEVAVNDARTEHLDGRSDEAVVHRSSRHGIERKIAQARGGPSFGVGDELHQEDALDEMVGHGNADARRVETVNHVHLGRAPGGLVLLSTVSGAVGDRALIAAVPDPAPLGVRGALLEGAVMRVLVDLGHRVAAPGHDQVHLSFLAAHERSNHVVDDSVVEERRQAVGHPHAGGTLPHSWCGHLAQFMPVVLAAGDRGRSAGRRSQPWASSARFALRSGDPMTPEHARVLARYNRWMNDDSARVPEPLRFPDETRRSS